MITVMTKVKLKPGTADACARLFQETNPALVANASDWKGAQMLFDEENNTVTVLATWSDLESYHRLRSSEAFGTTMARFAQFFAGPPDITSHRLLVEMSPS